MRTGGVAWACLLVAGCTTPAYWVAPTDVGAAVTPAVRARDGAEVSLRGGTYRATGEVARPDGRVVVRGPGRHSATFKAGAIALGAGLVLAIGGAVMAVTTLQHGCSISYGDCSSEDLRENQFWAGFVISIIGDAGWGIVGPALMIKGSLQAPVEVSNAVR